MLLLLLCGVKREAIVEDYMMSEKVLKQSRMHNELDLDGAPPHPCTSVTEFQDEHRGAAASMRGFFCAHNGTGSEKLQEHLGCTFVCVIYLLKDLGVLSKTRRAQGWPSSKGGHKISYRRLCAASATTKRPVSVRCSVPYCG